MSDRTDCCIAFARSTTFYFFMVFLLSLLEAMADNGNDNGPGCDGRSLHFLLGAGVPLPLRRPLPIRLGAMVSK
jgi:hypothetical protein